MLFNKVPNLFHYTQYGSHFQGSGSQVSNYFLGYIFENGVLNNSTANIAKVLSLRAKIKYRS